MHRLAVLGATVALAGCVSAPKPAAPVTTRPPPQTSGPVAAPSSRGFIAPTVMRMPGLERVIGADARRLSEEFGSPRLTVPEGDAVKLQFSGTSCVSPAPRRSACRHACGGAPGQRRAGRRPCRLRRGSQTVKDSPQPQLPVAFGFWKTKPAEKSSSTQSIVLPTR